MSDKEPDQRLTPAEHARLVERYHETMMLQKYISEHHLQHALSVAGRLGERLKVIKGGSR